MTTPPTSAAEVNAAFNVVHPVLVNLINENVPFFYQNTLLEKLAEPATVELIVHTLYAAIAAAEKVRDATKS